MGKNPDLSKLIFLKREQIFNLPENSTLKERVQSYQKIKATLRTILHFPAKLRNTVM